jgi:hypothetical protein
MWLRQTMYRLTPSALDRAGDLLALDQWGALWKAGPEQVPLRLGRLRPPVNPACLCVADDGAVWVAALEGRQVVRYPPAVATSSDVTCKARPTVEVSVADRSYVVDLAAGTHGEVMVSCAGRAMRRYAADGRLVAEYTQDAAEAAVGQRGTWGADVALAFAMSADGTVHGCSVGRADDSGRLLSAPVYVWHRPDHFDWRVVDLRHLGRVTGFELLLKHAGASGEIYFQYYLRDQDASPGSHWPGPMAIARCGPNGRAREVFDIRRHYRAEQARDQAWRCGDLIQVSPCGDLYIEIQTKDCYRVDRVSFRRWWQRRTLTKVELP